MSDRLNELRKRVLIEVGLVGEDLPVVNRHGEQQVVVALSDEPVSVLLKRLKNAGGAANVYVGDTQGSIARVNVIDGDNALLRGEQNLDLFDDNAADIGTLLDYLRQHPSGVELRVMSRQAVTRAVLA